MTRSVGLAKITSLADLAKSGVKLALCVDTAPCGVTADQVLFVVEAMKMQNQVRAGIDGVVTEVAAAKGEAVSTGTLLARVEPAAH